MYLLDTDILSDLLKRRPSVELQAKLKMVPVQNQYTSSITLGELVYGARKRGGDLGERLVKQFQSVLLPNLSVLPFDEPAAWRYGQVRAELENQGTPAPEADLRIAAIALARGMTVVTANVRHFGRIAGLTVENWLRPG